MILSKVSWDILLTFIDQNFQEMGKWVTTPVGKITCCVVFGSEFGSPVTM